MPRNPPPVRYRRIVEAIKGSDLFTVNRGLSAAYAPGVATDALYGGLKLDTMPEERFSCLGDRLDRLGLTDPFDYKASGHD